MDAVAELEQGRECCEEQQWAQAYELLTAADEAAGLGPEDLEALARAAYMVGSDEEFVEALERAHHAYAEVGEQYAAARCAFWAGFNLLAGGETSRANGWFGRAQRLVDREGVDCIEQGWLLIPQMLEQEDKGDVEAAYATSSKTAEIAERFGDRDLGALAAMSQGQALVLLGRREEGLRLLDENLVQAAAGVFSPVVTGIVYCGTIDFCQSVYELQRARDWTEALSRWWDEHPEMVAGTGICLVHRAEVMEISGAWQQALEEARRAHARFELGTARRPTVGRAHYRQGELHRLRGELDEAEAAYREAAGCGWEPQPGLALLRLAQGRDEAAAGAIRRVLGETSGSDQRLTLLPAAVEILVVAGELDEARAICGELAEAAERLQGGVVEALALRARGAVELAAGDPGDALVSLRGSFRAWQELDAPYEAARTRVLIGRACRALGDEDAAALEADAARSIFAELGAVTDLAWLDPLAATGSGDSHGLTGRELEVLRLVAAGDSNREIATALVISEHTVARHLQNIFAKLSVSSRTAAGAFAFEHDLA
jgi:DNA-binding CsgD family transcriptional regulator